MTAPQPSHDLNKDRHAQPCLEGHILLGKIKFQLPYPNDAATSPHRWKAAQAQQLKELSRCTSAWKHDHIFTVTQLASLLVNHFPADVQHQRREIDNGIQQHVVPEQNRADTYKRQWIPRCINEVWENVPPSSLLFVYFSIAATSLTSVLQEHWCSSVSSFKNYLYVGLLGSKRNNSLTGRWKGIILERIGGSSDSQWL